MIRVVIKREAKDVGILMDFLRQLRRSALPEPGYVTGETLININNRQIVTVISTWRSLEDWKRWETSAQRDEIAREIEPLLVTQPSTEIYELLSA
ncbi:MAG: antibiotic biosynthesis monooxygenase [Deltaproteobacteria bacterium]|nr:antibiotic biosynthesis monooxygenase [Deltaproteobacteria bacterium]